MAQKIIQGDVNITGAIKHNGSEISYEGIPSATAKNKVLVSNDQLKFVEQNAVPEAENLTPVPDANDTLYANGPTGGFTDISTGEEAYLQEIKGYTLVWNVQKKSSGYFYPTLSHYYAKVSKSTGDVTIINNTSATVDAYSYCLIDLTQMFGDNKNIPFKLTSVTDYAQNFNISATVTTPENAFCRLFPNVNFKSLAADEGSFKTATTTKLIETGQNLWDAATMDGDSGTGLKLLPGYKYEIYYDGNKTSGTNTVYVWVSYDNGANWVNASLDWSKKQRSDGKYVCYISTTRTCLIKSYPSYSCKICYVGFVHSGNYCLTSGTITTITGTACVTTDVPIPEYKKYEFDAVSSGLNGIPDNSENHCSVYDTKDIQRVGVIDNLSTLTWTDIGGNTWTATISDIKEDTTALLAINYTQSQMSVSGTTITIAGTTASPTGKLLYELATPVETGQPAFEPIALKDQQGNWIVNDMGSEYFTGLTYCPANQLSYYYANLKDKIVNLQDPIDIEEVAHKDANKTLYGIQIDKENYNVSLVKIDKEHNYVGIQSTNEILSNSYNQYKHYTNSVIIGESAIASWQSGYSVPPDVTVVGYAANTGYQGTAIGSQTYAAGTRSVAIGVYSKNATGTSVSFDGCENPSAAEAQRNYINRTVQLFGPEKIFFRNANIGDASVYSLKGFSAYKLGHYLNEYVQNNALTLQDGKYYVAYTDASNYKTFSVNVVSGTSTDITSTVNGAHITVVLTDSDTTPTWHSVVGMDLMLYDSTNSLPYNSYARIDCGGTVEDIVAHIDADGCVVITAPTGTVISSVKYNIR